MSTGWPVRRTTSYGGVVVDDDGAVVMIKPAGKDVWALPKGGAEDGEGAEEAALREVREETGIEAEIVEALDPITYLFAWAPDKVRYRKTVRFFLMRATGGSPDDHDDEVDAVRFVPLAEAIGKAKYRTEKDVLKQAQARL